MESTKAYPTDSENISQQPEVVRLTKRFSKIPSTVFWPPQEVAHMVNEVKYSRFTETGEVRHQCRSIS